MQKLILILAVVCIVGGSASAMDEDEGTNGEDPAGCEDDPHLCAEPDHDMEPPSGNDQECYSCDTWEATCDTSFVAVCWPTSEYEPVGFCDVATNWWHPDCQSPAPLPGPNDYDPDARPRCHLTQSRLDCWPIP
jgi:hypothetical protein